MRQATYTTTRLGVYTVLFEHFSQDGKPPSFLTKAGIGVTSGLCGAFVGTPAEVALIRMTSDGRLIKLRCVYFNVLIILYPTLKRV